ncbi:MAG TPA: M56 family metallopeptidase [Terracidiphilus sp.]
MNSVLFPVLLEAALRALAAAIIVWAALHLLRVRSVPTQKTAWTLMLLGAVAMPLLMRWHWLPAADVVAVPAFSRDLVSPQSAPIAARPAAALADNVASAPETAPLPTAFASPVAPVAARDGKSHYDQTDLRGSPALPSVAFPLQPSPPDTATPMRSAADPAQWESRKLLTLVWFLYIAVTAVLLLRLLGRLASALCLWVTADPVLSTTLADLAAPGTVRWSSRVTSPANLGSGIILPAEYGEWSDEKLRVVLAHECAHVRQHDFYLQLLASAYAAFTWFSPLGWWIRRKLSELGEAIGDRAGLQEAASPSSYAQVLLEFAALPRPTRIGVAMARPRHLASRIERVLNDNTLSQAFATNRRRAVLALAIAPLALLASAALVRVQAAGQSLAPVQQSSQAQMIPASQDSGVSNPPVSAVTSQEQPSSATAPEPAPIPAAAPTPAPPQPAAGPGPAPAPEPAPQAEPAPPTPPTAGAVTVPPVPPIDVHVPPMPAIHVQIPPMPDVSAEISRSMMQLDAMGKNFDGNRRFFAYDGGQAWALVPAEGEPIMNLSSSEQRAAFEETHKTAHAPFFWFQRDGKSYIIDDPTVVAQIESFEKPMENLRSQMRELGKQQRDLGQQMRQQMREQRQAPIPKPDLSKQMADLNAAVDNLKASQGDTISRDQLMKLQRQVGELQGQLGRLEGGFYKQNGQWAASMGAFGKQMGQLGAEQGRLAGEMARSSMENRSKIDSIIGQSLQNGKAKSLK